MNCGKQEALYLTFILIALGGAMLYSYTEPTYGASGPLKPITFAQKFQYWGAFFLLAVAAITVFLSASKMSDSDDLNYAHSHPHHQNTNQPGFLI